MTLSSHPNGSKRETWEWIRDVCRVISLLQCIVLHNVSLLISKCGKTNEEMPPPLNTVPVWCGWDGMDYILMTRNILRFPSDGGSLGTITMAVWLDVHLQHTKKQKINYLILQVIKYVQKNQARMGNYLPVWAFLCNFATYEIPCLLIPWKLLQNLETNCQLRRRRIHSCRRTDRKTDNTSQFLKKIQQWMLRNLLCKKTRVGYQKMYRDIQSAISNINNLS